MSAHGCLKSARAHCRIACWLIACWLILALGTGVAEAGPKSPSGSSSQTLPPGPVEPGQLTVVGSPVGADVLVTGSLGLKEAGRIPMPSFEIPAGAYQVQVSMEGYRSQTVSIWVAPGRSVAATVRLQRLGYLGVSGSPSGASVKVSGAEGTQEFTLPADRVGMIPGPYRVTVSAPDYEPITQTVEIAEGAQSGLEFNLRRSRGEINFQGSPANARLQITGPDGASSTLEGLPATLASAPWGTYSVKATADGYAPGEQSFKLEAGEKRVQTFTLSCNGVLEVQARPAKTRAVITGPDGKVLEPARTPSSWTGLCPGEYSVRLSKRPFKPEIRVAALPASPTVKARLHPRVELWVGTGLLAAGIVTATRIPSLDANVESTRAAYLALEPGTAQVSFDAAYESAESASTMATAARVVATSLLATGVISIGFSFR